MIPNQDAFDQLEPDFEEVIGPTKNYRVVWEKEKVAGFVDNIESMKQAIYLLLSTERYQYSIYSFNAGAQLADLIGKPVSYVASEVKRRIRDCLMQDDRITEVDNFKVTIKKNTVTVWYIAHTIYGDIEGEREVAF